VCWVESGVFGKCVSEALEEKEKHVVKRKGRKDAEAARGENGGWKRVGGSVGFVHDLSGDLHSNGGKFTVIEGVRHGEAETVKAIAVGSGQDEGVESSWFGFTGEC
jgi:hypothetical protein